MHDWTRVEPNYFHAFHVAWVAAFQHALNNGALPPGYYALAEQVAPPIEPDLLTLQVPAPRNGTPHHSTPTFPIEGGPLTLTAAPPGVRFTAAEPKAKSQAASRRQRRITIRHSSTHRLVAVIEIVSPANKAGKKEFRRFVDKAVALLEQHIHLLLIDPFPPTARDPNGLHAAVWWELVRKRFTPPPDKPLTLASYAAEPDDRFAAYVEPLAVGDPIRDMPLFLTAEQYVNVPLEETYRRAWAGFPKPWQEVIEGR
jgi:hypothetical protein